jgi:hypothetical protein
MPFSFALAVAVQVSVCYASSVSVHTTSGILRGIETNGREFRPNPIPESNHTLSVFLFAVLTLKGIVGLRPGCFSISLRGS